MLGAAALWALTLAGLALLLDRPAPPDVLGWLLAGWLFLVPGPLGLFFGRWGWLVPVAAGLGALAWIAPSGLGSRLGNLSIPAVIFALAPTAVLTGFGAALRPRPSSPEDDPAPVNPAVPPVAGAPGDR
ncbi:MAG: hypothetical protein ACKOWF_00785 [Chloroflexota bacterium]